MPGNRTNLISKLIDILIRFRSYKVAVINIIKQAFLNVSVNESYRNFLRFLWVKDISSDKSEVIVRCFTRVAFGTTAPQFKLAVSIHKHLLTCKNVDQNVVEKFLANLYADDNINGNDSYGKNFQLHKKNVGYMKDAGFELRKFHTTDPNLQTAINKIEKFQSLEDNLKVLGIDWHKQNDSFIIDLNKIYEVVNELTRAKRSALKIKASIYDPIGIISPVVVLFKILFQEISLLKCEWDSGLSPGLKSKWEKLLNSLKEIALTVPRFYFCFFNSATVFDLHAFSEARKRAYATVICLSNGESSTLVLSKTKVVPIQPIPLIELLSCLSRGTTAIDFYNLFSEWNNGPTFLRQIINTWPVEIL